MKTPLDFMRFRALSVNAWADQRHAYVLVWMNWGNPGREIDAQERTFKPLPAKSTQFSSGCTTPFIL